MVNTLTLADVAEHNSKKSIYLVVYDKVYDVSKFIDEHPGGEEVLLDEGGKDATEAFEDVGHSEEAREVLKTLYIADLKRDGNAPTYKPSKKPTPLPKPSSEPQGSALRIIIPVVIVGAWLAYRFFA
ncbi:cytochrome b5-like heme/steroid binding domain-containing protein [Endogone sp. FLAS-F59071]|nr:cytochrome b5-like heme/steroid binding domain-containing protein [Endogone sp. FLAS-F59071]|eukprot:RUS16147.1 cytochrome b5-like heme/steroid binding domain-containing protein [Endogone sp. FLAS-F59071]